ncbi:GNAT family N-acetyltransferase [Microbacterium esteraromaticum]|uniref:GNAT family N-acetyltransferase n=3 Tax=Microbacterium esteraromaticum TaxID=57043 RepID=A0A939DX85_9MICO|nr:GNAT family N-acetyltransferase [Microbacterium esteraromaticum]MBN8416214.1 GNAT family N-acetyltransferase [Microbacterium esteraromaticum]MBN8423429.1 GNAT family N-acetyltransferase [Microbacterium esteraromaticum]
MASHVRIATDSDLPSIARIEAAADTVFDAIADRTEWGSPPSGQDRCQHPGFLLVAADDEAGPAVGFVHVITHDDVAHLEQLSVLPEHARLGHGTALVHAALDEARARGAKLITLRTFAEIPWNAPFYASLGFAEIPTPSDSFTTALLDAEQRAGLADVGPRVHMSLDLGAGMEMDADAFEALVIDELDKLPDDMVDGLDNVVFVVEDRAETGEELFGLYEGFALTDRGQYGMGELPDRIIVFRETHLAACADEAALRAEVHTTLVHEIAHFYGIDDEQLHELGWA